MGVAPPPSSAVPSAASLAPALEWPDPERPFAPALEAEYLRAQLLQNRPIIRGAATVALLVAIARIAEQFSSATPGPLLIAQFALIIAGSVALVALAWSAALERRYLPAAELIVPLRNALVAAHLAVAATHGEPDLLMILPLMLIGPFLFMGLRFRVALLCGVVTGVTFVLLAAGLHLRQPFLLRSGVLLALALIACAVTRLQIERLARMAFLERRVMTEFAQRDALTGAKNRRVFDEHLTRIWQHAAADRAALAIVLIDVDHFKSYNDRHGHLAGDEALRHIARSVQTFVLGAQDILARYGGEEFAAVLYGIEAQQAWELAERMRRAVMGLTIDHGRYRSAQRVTISVGVAAIHPAPERDCRGALQLADQALYEAKLRGRNRVELMDEAHYELIETGVFRASVSESVQSAWRS